jgi:hypothetical protein
MNIGFLKSRIQQFVVFTVFMGVMLNVSHAQTSTAEVEAHNRFGSGFGNNGSSGGGGGGGGTDPGSGTQPQPSPTPETFQAAFEVGASGKQIKQDCAVCHWLEVLVDGRKLEYGETVTLTKNKTHQVTVTDNPQTRGSPPTDATPPHDDNQTFTVYPAAVGNQTITEVPGDAGNPPKAFIVNKDSVLDYIIDNSEKLLAKNKEWPKSPADEPMNKKALLVPVDITIKKDGDTAPPTDGVIVKKGDTLSIGLNGSDQSNATIFTGQPVWKYRQLKPDGTYTDWTPFGDSGIGSQFSYTTTTSGIFQVEAVFFGDDANAVKYLRKKDELKTSSGSMGPGRKGQPDSFGVCDTQKQIDIRNEAKRYLGSPAYGSDTPVPPEFGFSGFGTEGNARVRCNIFVAHRCCAVGATVPAINGNGITSFYPPLANQWAGIQNCRPFPLNPIDISGPTYDIDHWSAASLVNPQPGFIIAHPIPDDAGHCGIIDYDGGGIGAGSSYPFTINKKYEFYDGTSRWRQYQQ